MTTGRKVFTLQTLPGSDEPFDLKAKGSIQHAGLTAIRLVFVVPHLGVTAEGEEKVGMFTVT
ncbi:MAG: hypothetical protein AB2551_12370 [Candidatus Thiodiazotropha sp.]